MLRKRLTDVPSQKCDIIRVKHNEVWKLKIINPDILQTYLLCPTAYQAIFVLLIALKTLTLSDYTFFFFTDFHENELLLFYRAD